MPEQTDEQATPKIYNDPISVAKRTKQKIHLVSQTDKIAMLEQILKHSENAQTVIVTKTKRDADTLSKHLISKGIDAIALHANIHAQAREERVQAFSEGKISVLITTDMILQSLEIGGLDLVLGYDLPIEPNHYLSRLGCLGETGEAISLVSEDDEIFLFLIERTMRQEIPQEELEGFGPSPEDASKQVEKSQKKKPRHSKQKSKNKDKKQKKSDTKTEE